MSQSIEESMIKIAKRDQDIARRGIPVRQDAYKGGHLDYTYTIGSTTGKPPVNALTTAANIDFELKGNPGLYLKDNKSLILALKVAETGGTNSVKATFAESFFDTKSSFEFLMDQQQIYTPTPMIQTVLEPAIEHSSVQYQSLCNTLNHNASMSYTSPVSITAGSSQWYFVRVPNPLPQSGFYFGALGTHILTLRCKTQNAVDSGTGTLSLLDAVLICECVLVPSPEIPRFQRDWENKVWTAQLCSLLEPNQINLVASGESPRIPLPGTKDLPVTSLYSYVHASRSLTASAYWNLIALPTGAKVTILDRSGTQLFSSSQELIGYQRYYKGARLLGDSGLLASVPFIISNPSPNIQEAIHAGHDEHSRMIFTGDETLVISDSGSTASVYVDTACFYNGIFQMRNGVISKVANS